MNTGAIAQFSTALSNQRTNAELEVAVVNLAKDNMKLQGQAAMQLIESIPQPQGNVGNNINIKV
jgi:hypothetical protein